MVRAVALALALTPSFGACASPVDSAQEVRPKRLAVTLLGGAEGLEEGLLRADPLRWAAARLEGWAVSVNRPGDGAPAAAEADLSVVVALLPAAEEARELLAGLPVELDADRLALGGTVYDAHAVSLAAHLPGSAERWLVTSADPDLLVEAAARVVVRAAGGRRFGEDADRDLDVEVRASRWLRRTGAWRRSRDGWEVDPRSERDDFDDRERWLASLEPLDGGAVRLLVPAARAGSAELARLAVDLGHAATAMASRVPVDPEALRRRPVTVAIEADHVAQIRHAAAVGPAVPGRPSGLVGAASPPDLHLVPHPDDLWAYEHALARHLLARAGGADAPPLLVDGAAWWLAELASEARPRGESGGWFGWGTERWLPVLAATALLPEAADLASSEPAGDASEVLWVPAASAVVAGLPGESAIERLASADRAGVGRALAQLASAASRAPEPPAGAPLPPGFLAGVSFAMLNSLDGGYHAPAVSSALDRLIEVGADAVSIMPFASQPDPVAPSLRFLDDSPTSETGVGLVHAARVARQKGLTVLWKPHLWVGHESWPGEVEMHSEDDWRAWWRSYRRYVLHHAVLARYSGAEIFAVGVELERTVEREDDWRRLIRDVRRVFPGAVTYAANWGAGADRVAFWDALDAAGVDAYYPLAETASASDRALRRGAEAAAARLEGVARRAGKPLILTEVGFAARRGAWVEPHRDGEDLSVEDQARAYHALFAALEGRPWLRGVFVWKAFSGERPSWAAGERSDFRFLGRPAEDVVAAFFRRQERDGGVAPGRP